MPTDSAVVTEVLHPGMSTRRAEAVALSRSSRETAKFRAAQAVGKTRLPVVLKRGLMLHQ